MVAPTGAVLDDLRREYGLLLRNAAIIANGVDIGAFSPRPKRPRIMASGRVWDEAKNLLVLGDIAALLAWPVEIAGETVHPEHGAADLRRARSLGVLDAAEMRQWLARGAIFAAPARYEPFGLGVLAAAAAGCVLVLGDIASLRETWDGAAIFLPAEDAGRWRATLAQLIEDRGECRRLGLTACKGARRAFHPRPHRPQLSRALSRTRRQRGRTAGRLMARVALFCHSLCSDWNHGNAHFLRGVLGELQRRGVAVVPSSRKMAGVRAIWPPISGRLLLPNGTPSIRI